MGVVPHEHVPARLDTARIERGDTISNPKLVEDDALMKFNVVVANPPFSLDKWGADIAEHDKYKRFWRGTPPKSRGDYAFITHMVETLNETDGRVGVVVPHGVLFRGGSEGTIRQRFIEENLLDGVIGLPANLFFGVGIPAALLFFRRNKKDKNVFFIDASREFAEGKNQNRLREEDLAKIVATWRARQDVPKYAHLATPEELKDNDYNLNIPLYVDTFEEEDRWTSTQSGQRSQDRGRARLNASRSFARSPGVKVVTSTVELGSLVLPEAPICYGILMPGEDTDGGVPVVKVRDYDHRGIEVGQLLRAAPSIETPYRRSRLEPGDLLMSIRGTTGVIAIVPPELVGANITQDTARIRVNVANRDYLYQALHAPYVRRQIRLHTIGQAVKGINIGAVRKLEIPWPSTATRQLIARILGDCDSLMRITGRLAEAKRTFRRGLRHQLLIGRRRFPQFVTSKDRQPGEFGTIPQD